MGLNLKFVISEEDIALETLVGSKMATIWSLLRCAVLWLAKLPGECTEVRFASFISGGFTTMAPVAVINPPERKLAKHTSVE